MSELTEFLLGRIAEDERQAGTCHKLGWFPGKKYEVTTVSYARVLAECEAKRAIVGMHANEGEEWDLAYCAVCHDRDKHDQLDWPCPTIRTLAAVYADHEDYQPEWKAGWRG